MEDDKIELPVSVPMSVPVSIPLEAVPIKKKNPLTVKQIEALAKAREIRALKNKIKKHDLEMQNKPSHLAKDKQKQQNSEPIDIIPTVQNNDSKINELLNKISFLENQIKTNKVSNIIPRF